jgi:hypothetical protein
VLASDHSQQVRLVPDETGKLEPRLIYNKKTVYLSGNAKQHQITIDASAGASEVRRIIQRELARAQRDNPMIHVPTDAEIDQAVDACMRNIQTIEQPLSTRHLQDCL